jgi:hypothetical protein
VTPAGYWPSPWPGEDGGPTRGQAPHGTPGLGLVEGEALEVTRREIAMGTMVVLRDPGEVYLLRHTMGDDTRAWVEQVDPVTLEPVARSVDLDAGPFWPGGVACHANGSLYVTYGTWCHRLDPDLSVVASRRLPCDRPYNSLVILADGSLAMKDFVNDGSTVSTLSILDPDDLADRGPPVSMPEGSISRLSADGSVLYALGERTALRYIWDPAAGGLALDDDWSVPYRTEADQSYAWDPVIAAGDVWFMDNGDHTYQGSMRGQGVAAGPVHLVRIPIEGGPVTLTEVSGRPHGTQTNLPLFDPDRSIAVAYDSGNGVLAAWHKEGDHLTGLWRHDMNASMHMIRYPDTGELVVNDHDPEAGDHLVVLDLGTGAEKARVATGSPEQAVVFPAVGFGRDVYYCSFSTLARISVDS